MRRALLAAAIGAGAALAGCFVITGGTDDSYHPPAFDAGDQADADLCAIDGGFSLGLGCSSSADCTGDDGGDAGGQCCLLGQLQGFGLCGVRTQCAPSCENAGGGKSVPLAQLCMSSGECADASCVSQTCLQKGSSIQISACGQLAFCH